MTDLTKRSVLKIAAISEVAAATLVACGKKEEAPKAAAKAEPLKARLATVVGPSPMTTRAKLLKSNLATKSSPALLRKCQKALTQSAFSVTWPPKAIN